MPGLIAIVGRPNVGKSALFNRIVGKRIAIVHDEPGVTRDRISVEAEWAGRAFTLVDTGGIGLVRREKALDVITEAARDQVQLAIETANAIILVVNVQEGVVPLDQEVAQMLRRSGKPVLVAVNKVDTAAADEGVGEFSELGFDKIFPVSAIHQRGVEDLMAAAMPFIPAEAMDAKTGEPETPPLKLAIVGRPNVGKSSIINALTRSERVIVTPIAGTTRDSVDVPFEVVTDGVPQRYILIDTAGVRQERRIDNSVEFFSVKRTEDSIARSDMVIFVIDAQAGVTSQDKKVAAKIIDERKACVVVVNKWDLVEGKELEEARQKEFTRRDTRKRDDTEERLATLGEFGGWVQEQLFFMDYAPVMFTSAKTGFNLDRLLETIRYVAAQLQQKIPTSLLNRTLRDSVEKRQPISAAGHRLKFFYATQVRQAPPTFLIFVNRDELFSDNYKKYLATEMRAAFGYEGCPIVMAAKPRPKTVEPVRQHHGGRGPAGRTPHGNQNRPYRAAGPAGKPARNAKPQKRQRLSGKQRAKR
jgi:GTP-binding protein